MVYLGAERNDWTFGQKGKGQGHILSKYPKTQAKTIIIMLRFNDLVTEFLRHNLQ